jgi:hypothetical protein
MLSCDNLTIAIITISIVFTVFIVYYQTTTTKSLFKNVGFLDNANKTSKITKNVNFDYIEKDKSDVSSKTTLQSYNLEEIDKVSKFIITNLNKNKKVCYNIIEIHRVKKEIDSRDIISFTLDLYVYDHIRNYGTLLRAIATDTNGTLAMKDVYFITPIPMSTNTEDGFSFEKLEHNTDNKMISMESDKNLNKAETFATYEPLF